MPSIIQSTMKFFSNWRLWCCGHPKVLAPISPSQPNYSYSLEEFDPHNILNIPDSHPSLDLLRSAALPKRASSAPAHGRKQTSVTETQIAPRSGDRHPSTTEGEDDEQPRPRTFLLPSPPRFPRLSRRLRDAQPVIVERKKQPRLARESSQTGGSWWQARRKLLEKNGQGEAAWF